MQTKISYADNWEKNDDRVSFEQEKKADNWTKAEADSNQKGVSYAGHSENHSDNNTAPFSIGPSVSTGQGNQTKPVTYDSYDQKGSTSDGTPTFSIGPNGKS
jgi:hypothetical protein